MPDNALPDDLLTLPAEPGWHREQRLLNSHYGQRLSWRTTYDQEFPVTTSKIRPQDWNGHVAAEFTDTGQAPIVPLAAALSSAERAATEVLAQYREILRRAS